MVKSKIVVNEAAAAMRELGLRMMAGDGVPLDQRGGFDLVQKAAHGGDAHAMFVLASVLLDSNHPESKTRAIENMQMSAGKEYAPAQYFLADQYLNGGLVDSNIPAGIKWVQRAILNEFPAAYGLFGRFLANENRTFEGLFWMEKAAKAGVEDLVEIISHLHKRVVAENIHKSEQPDIAKLTAAAKDGDGGEWILLAEIFDHGVFAPLDPGAATECIENAAALKNPEGEWRLAMRYIAGFTSRKGFIDGVKLLRASAAKGFTEAQVDLARLLIDKTRSIYNLDEAIVLLSAATKSGHQAAKEILAEVRGAKG